MENSILTFPEQFSYQPEIVNTDAVGGHTKFIVCGMGGSHLAAGLARRFLPNVEIREHRDYGLPFTGERLSEYLVIASSHSGNTEEVLDALETARSEGAATAAITTGGTLRSRAEEYGIPHVVMPDTGIQPRTALGFSFRALLALMGETALLRESDALAEALAPKALEARGAELAETLRDSIPVIYAAAHNESLAYNWKIKFNETGKIPAFMNVFPELNHNEMNGFGVTDTTRHLAERFHPVILKDPDDDPRITKRMDVLAAQLTDRGLPVQSIEPVEGTALERIFSSLLLADWTALATARHYDREPEQVPMIEEFKKRIA